MSRPAGRFFVLGDMVAGTAGGEYTPLTEPGWGQAY